MSPTVKFGRDAGIAFAIPSGVVEAALTRLVVKAGREAGSR